MIYLDHNATTLLDPTVLAAIDPLLHRLVGNASSTHRYGQESRALLVKATRDAAHFFCVSPEEILFTSGATEGLNLLLHNLPKKGHIITSSLEHRAVTESVKRSGCSATYLDPLPNRGAITREQVEAALQDNTQLIVLSGANNETGIRIDIEAIAACAASHHIPFVLDGVALLGKEELDLPPGVSAACFSGHKIHAPVGIGLCFVRKSYKLSPLIVGGAQQHGLRAGTENLIGIVGMVKALSLIQEKGKEDILYMTRLRDRFEEALLERLPDIVIHGKGEKRISNTSNIAFLGVEGEVLLALLDMAGLAASHGSACAAGALHTSHVLLHMGIEAAVARSSLRFSLSRFTSLVEIEKSVEIIVETVERVRQLTLH